MPPLTDVANYLSGQAAQTSPQLFVFNLVCVAFLCALLARFFVAFGSSTSNRRGFARIFVLLGLTTTLIVTVIKTSLALSLGLVGALSIVRFRGAIKEPEELAYVFACIAVGLGVGANQTIATVLCVCALIGVSYLNHRSRKDPLDCNLLMTISSDASEQAGCDGFVEILKKHCPEVSLRRLDETKGSLEAAFVLPGADYGAIESSKQELLQLSDSVRVSILDNEGVF